jgi:multiple sugar transport system substrate-binding protein
MTKKLNRRDFLKVGSIAGAGILGACAPQIVTQTVEVIKNVEVTKEVQVVETQMVEVTKEVVKEVAPADPWVTGLIAPDIAGEFNMVSWEGEGEMRKWLLHIGKFFTTYYPKVKWNLDWGIDWNNYWSKITTQIASGTPIEMMWMHDSKIHAFATRNLLVPMDDWLTKYPAPGWPDHFYKSQVDSFMHNGKQYSFPYDWAPGMFYVNTELIESAGFKVPDENTTWDQILEMATKISKNQNDPKTAIYGLGNVPTSWTGGLYWILKEFGGDYWTSDLKTATISDPKTVEGITFVRDLMWKQKVAPSAAAITGLGLDMETAFASGRIALQYDLNDVSFRINEAIAGKFKWTVCPTPTGPAGRFQFSGGSAFAIPTSSRQKDMAYELTRFVLANPDNLPTTAVMGGALVANMDYAEFGLPPKSTGIQDAFRHAAIEMGKKNPCMPNYHAKYLDWETTVWPLMDPIWNGEANGDITPIITKVQEGTQKILDELAAM